MPPFTFPSQRHRCGFSLTEAVIVIAVLALLIALFTGVVHRMTNHSRVVDHIGRMRELTRALLHYAQENNGRLPWGNNPGSASTGPETTWTREIALKGYLSRSEALFNPWCGDWYRTPAARWRALQTPASSSRVPWAYTNYGANRYGAMPHQASDGRSPANLFKVAAAGHSTRLILLREVYDPAEAERGGGALYFTRNTLLPNARKRGGYELICATFADGHLEAFSREAMERFGKSPQQAPYFENVYTRP